MRRIIMHWTAGGHYASELDRSHYHEIAQGNGQRVQGRLKPEANESTSDGQYVAHTRGLNTGSIGLSVAAMRGARENPFDPGDSPITPVQLKAFVEMVAEYAETYNIPVTRKTILSHAEVQVTLGVRQNGKWDIAWIPGMARPGDPVAVGDMIRKMVSDEMKKKFPPVPRRPWWTRWIA